MNKFCIKHIPNAVVRILTHDKYYMCEECGEIHKRDGKEIRLDEPGCGKLLSNPIWYGSVHIDCFNKQQREVFKLLHDAIFKRETDI